MIPRLTIPRLTAWPARMGHTNLLGTMTLVSSSLGGSPCSAVHRDFTSAPCKDEPASSPCSESLGRTLSMGTYLAWGLVWDLVWDPVKDPVKDSVLALPCS